MSNSQATAQGKAECNFDYYEYNYSLIALRCIQLPTNNIALPYNTLLLLGLPCVTIEARLLILLCPYSCSTLIIYLIIDIHPF